MLLGTLGASLLGIMQRAIGTSQVRGINRAGNGAITGGCLSKRSVDKNV